MQILSAQPKVITGLLFVWIIILTPSASYAKSFNLKSALSEIVEHPDHNILKNNLAESKKNRDQAFLSLTPSFSLNRTFSEQNLTSKTEVESYYFQTRVNIFKGFKDINNIMSTRQGLKKEQAKYTSSFNDQEYELSNLFFTCLFYDTNLKESKTVVSLTKQLKDIAQKRFKRGVSSRDDFIKLKVDHDTARVTFITASKLYDQCHHSLRYWLGDFDQLLTEDLFNKIEKSHNSKKTYKIEDHPEIIEKTATFNQSIWERRVNWGQWLPQVDLSYRDFPESSFQNNGYTLFLSAQWSLFDSGNQWTRQQISNIRSDSAASQLETQKRVVKRQMAIEKSELKSRLEQYKILLENHKSAQKLFNSSIKRFKVGAISANDVALDHNRLSASAFALHQAWLDSHLAWIKLLSSLGHSVTQYL